MAQKKLSYQEAYSQLESICNRIKDDSIPIEELPGEIRKARALVLYCENLLKQIDEELEAEELAG